VQQLGTSKGAAFDAAWTQAMRANLTATGQAITAVRGAGTSPTVKQVAQQWSPVLTQELTTLGANG
jgi:hypothetical protein